MSLIEPTIFGTAWNAARAVFGFVVRNWHWLLIVAVVIATVWAFQHEWKRTPKLNQPEIIKAQTAIAKQDREEMTKILVDSDVREKNIDANVAYSNTTVINAQAESKKQWADKSTDELAAELERRAKEDQ